MLLGVTPTSPGYATAAVKPLLGDLDWVDGVVPTARAGPMAWPSNAVVGFGHPLGNLGESWST